ncbi:alkaline phosphatase [Escherichia coli]
MRKDFSCQEFEGASIDKQDHAANPCGQIGETVDLDEAVQRALEFAKKDGNTLVIVTADRPRQPDCRAGYQSSGPHPGAKYQRWRSDGDELRELRRGFTRTYRQSVAYCGVWPACRQCLVV